MIILKIFISGVFSTNTFCLICPHSKEAVVIDPAMGCFNGVMEFLEKNGASLKYILLTHSHWDHIGDVAKLKEKTKAEVCLHEDDSANLKEPGSDGLPLFEKITGVIPDFYVKDGDIIQFGDISLEVITTPGHSAGSVCFYNEKEKILFSGDTLFAGTMGNIGFPTSVPDKMAGSLKRLSTLPEDVVVYPGHGEKTTIGQESWLFNP